MKTIIFTQDILNFISIIINLKYLKINQVLIFFSKPHNPLSKPNFVTPKTSNQAMKSNSSLKRKNKKSHLTKSTIQIFLHNVKNQENRPKMEAELAKAYIDV